MKRQLKFTALMWLTFSILVLMSLYLSKDIRSQIEPVEAAEMVQVSGSVMKLEDNYKRKVQMVIDYEVDWYSLPFSKNNVLLYLRYKGEDVNTWSKVIEGESSWDLYAQNPNSAAYGLYQIMPLTAGDYCAANYLQTWVHSSDCAINIRNAQGWTAWEAYKLLK